jgi:hypothetical protein
VFDGQLLVFIGTAPHIRHVLEATMRNLCLFAFNIVAAIQRRQFYLLKFCMTVEINRLCKHVMFYRNSQLISLPVPTSPETGQSKPDGLN